jgi:CubicO group peptidase (beta-lactamase class C family)
MQTIKSWLFAFLLTSGLAQSAALEQQTVSPSSESVPHALNAADLEAWLDGYFPYALHTGDIAGAVVVVVKDGQILLEKGYGYADYEKRTPVDPKTTLFRWGSISKLFTWTAVMQLVEQGKINLDADVNQYLDFKIPPREGKPVTMRNIMTHTAGFEERLTGLIGAEANGVEPLDKFIKAYIPARIFPPGETPAYSNFATALAGYIVARVSGVPFDDYIDKHLFEPLEMQRSTFRQPIPDSFKPNLARGYQSASLPAKPFEIVGPAPAGSLSAAGDDMAHFMIAHLQNGRYGANQILTPETAQQMHNTPLTILPRVNSMMLGFYENNRNGHRVIAHGGDTQWFHSDLQLFIEDGVGLLVSMNSIGKDGAAHGIRTQLFREFADRYFPGPTPDGSVDEKTAKEHAAMIAGRYAVSRRVDTSFVSLLYLLSQPKVVDNGDGTIAVSSETSPSGVPLRWREISPFVWREKNGKDLLSARVENGRVVRFAFGEQSPFDVNDRTPWFKSAGFWLPVIILSLGVLLLNTLAWPVGAFTRRHYRIPFALTGRNANARRLTQIAAASSLVIFAGWFVLVATMTSVLDLIPKMTGWVAFLHILSPFVFVGAAAAGLWNALVVAQSNRSRWVKVWAALLAASLLAVLWAAISFNLISFQSGF